LAGFRGKEVAAKSFVNSKCFKDIARGPGSPAGASVGPGAPCFAQPGLPSPMLGQSRTQHWPRNGTWERAG